MAQKPSIFPICQRIRSIAPRALFWGKHLAKKWLLPRENLCFARPHFSLVKEKILQPKSKAPDISGRPNQRLHLQPQNKESSALNHAASQAHNFSMDSRHQRLAVYTYMWARQGRIQPKHILLIRTKELGLVWDSLRFFHQPSPATDAGPLAQKYAFHVVREKGGEQPIPLRPEPERHFLMIRPMSYRGPVSPI